ncbi:hypothetical protein ACX0G9_13960 [Flavitalea flava]
MTTETLYYLFNHYSSVALLTREMEYEALTNLRLPKEMIISLES